MNIRKSPESLKVNQDKSPHSLDSRIEEALKISENQNNLDIKSNMKDTVSKLAENNLDLLKSTLLTNIDSLENNDIIPKKTNFSKNGENIFGPIFKPYEVNENDSNFKQITSAGIYSGKVIGKFGLGVIKGLLNSPRDLTSWIQGKAFYKSPSPLPDTFT